MRPLLALPFLMTLAATSLRAQQYRDPEESKFTIVNIESINSPSDDYAPVMTPDGRWLYLTSSRSGSADLLRSRGSAGGWDVPEPLPEGELNTSRDEGSFAAPAPTLAQLFELDAEMLRGANLPRVALLTCAKRAGGQGDADLYTVPFGYDDNPPVTINALAGVNSEEWDAQGTIAPDGGFIVFSSTRSGGEGDMDLWISTRNADGVYGAPVNLGAQINTSGNEFSPFVAPDGRTLFFASDGHEGFGGSDIMMTHRDEAGNWSAPSNLGGAINTSSNELFFFGLNRGRCYFASDRPGGKGGLDIYQGTPNIFAPGQALFHFSLVDTTLGIPLAGAMEVVETSTGRSIARVAVNAGNGADLPLVAGFSYRVMISSQGFPSLTRTISGFRADTTVNYTVNLGSAPPPPAPPQVFNFTYDTLTAPMFLSGYYRLNTSELLEDLRRRQLSGDLKSQAYIADVARDKAKFAQSKADAAKVDLILARFVKLCEEQYFPDFIAYSSAKSPDAPREHMEISVYGSADPRPLVGTYVEKPITFLDSNDVMTTVATGDKIDNFRLAGLRAYYTMEDLDKLLRASAPNLYTSLLEKKMLRWRVVSGRIGGSDEPEDLKAQRRIETTIRIVKD